MYFIVSPLMVAFDFFFQKQEAMENSKEGKIPVLSEEKKDDSGADLPAEEIEDDRDTVSDSDSSSDSSSDSDSDSEYECEICNKKFSGYSSFRQHQKGKKHAKALLKRKKEKKLMKLDKTSESDEENLVQEIYAECKICNKEFYGPEAYEQHLKSKKHKQKTLVASILEQVREEGKINESKLRELYKNKRETKDGVEDVKERSAAFTLADEDEKNQEEFECKECEKLFSGLIPYIQHLVSKTHAKKVEKNSLLPKINPGSFKEDETPETSKYDENTLCVEDDILICKSCSTAFSGPENAMTHIKSKKHAKNLKKYLRKLEKRKQKKESKEKDLDSSKIGQVEQESQEET